MIGSYFQEGPELGISNCIIEVIYFRTKKKAKVRLCGNSGIYCSEPDSITGDGVPGSRVAAVGGTHRSQRSWGVTVKVVSEPDFSHRLLVEMLTFKKRNLYETFVMIQYYNNTHVVK